MSKILEWFWRLLPDKCDMPGCSRQGVRGNETRVAGRVVCDGCHSKMMGRASGGTQAAHHDKIGRWVG